MRHISIIAIAIQSLVLYGCGANVYDPNSMPKEANTRTISENPSPDKTKLLTLKEHSWKGERGYTQVFIEFQGSGSSVYSVDTTGVDIRTYWVDDNHIIIETKKDYKGREKWNQVQNFGDIVKVRYVER